MLEFGGRYGVSSYCIQNKLKNKKLHLIVEPYKSVLVSLDKNITNNLMECKVFNGIISTKKQKIQHLGLATFTYICEDCETDIESKSLYDLELATKFDTLVVDCEGCFINFFEEYKNYILENIRKIIIEVDKIGHNEVFDILLKNNFKIVEKYFNHIIVFIRFT